MSKVKCQGEAQKPWEQHGQRLRRGTVPGKSEKRQEEERMTGEELGRIAGREEVRERIEPQGFVAHWKVAFSFAVWMVGSQCQLEHCSDMV